MAFAAASAARPSAAVVDLAKRRCGGAREELRCRGGGATDRLCHAIVEQSAERGRERPECGIGIREAPSGAPLDALHRAQTAALRDVGRLCRPRRDGAGAGNDDQRVVFAPGLRAGVKESFEARVLHFVEGAAELHEVQVPGRERTHRGHAPSGLGEQALAPEVGERARAFEDEDRFGRRGHRSGGMIVHSRAFSRWRHRGDLAPRSRCDPPYTAGAFHVEARTAC